MAAGICKVQLDFIPFRNSPVIVINCSRFSLGDPDYQPNWFHWGEEQSFWLQCSDPLWSKYLLTFPFSAESEPKGANQFSGVHQGDAFESFNMICRAKWADHLVSSKQKLRKWWEERDKNGFLPFPQHPALLGICSMRGTSFIGLLRTLETAHRCLQCDFFILFKGKDLQPRLCSWEATYL